MIFVPSKNIYFPKYQRGNFSMFPAGTTSITGGATQPAGTVILSGELVNSVWTDEVGIRFNNDGTVDKKVGAVYTQVDSGTDWIIPNGDAPDLFEVMTDSWVDTGGAQDGFESSAAAEGVWIALTSDRQWSVKGVAQYGADSNSMQFDAHIRWNGGATIDTGAYDIASEFE